MVWGGKLEEGLEVDQDKETPFCYWSIDIYILSSTGCWNIDHEGNSWNPPDKWQPICIPEAPPIPKG